MTFEEVGAGEETSEVSTFADSVTTKTYNLKNAEGKYLDKEGNFVAEDKNLATVTLKGSKLTVEGQVTIEVEAQTRTSNQKLATATVKFDQPKFAKDLVLSTVKTGDAEDATEVKEGNDHKIVFDKENAEEDLELTFKGTDQNGKEIATVKDVILTSGDDTVVEITDGKLEAVGLGTTTVYARVEGHDESVALAVEVTQEAFNAIYESQITALKALETAAAKDLTVEDNLSAAEGKLENAEEQFTGDFNKKSESGVPALVARYEAAKKTVEDARVDFNKAAEFANLNKVSFKKVFERRAKVEGERTGDKHLQTMLDWSEVEAAGKVEDVFSSFDITLYDGETELVTNSIADHYKGKISGADSTTFFYHRTKKLEETGKSAWIKRAYEGATGKAEEDYKKVAKPTKVVFKAETKLGNTIEKSVNITYSADEGNEDSANMINE